jgi:hypothetical protein
MAVAFAPFSIKKTQKEIVHHPEIVQIKTFSGHD